MDLNGKQLPSVDNVAHGAILVNQGGTWVAAQPEDIPGVQPNFVQRTGAAVSINPENNNVYLCGEVTGLSITNAPAHSIFVVRFTSGSTPTNLYMPEDVVMPDDFEVEANRTYELNIMDKYCTVASWEVTA